MLGWLAKLHRRCDFLLNDTNIIPNQKSRSARSRVAVLNECFFIALSDDGNMGVICGERLGKVLSSKQIANTIANQNNNFSNIRRRGNDSINASSMTTYQHPPTNLLHNTVCPDWSEVNAALGYAALLIR